MNRRSFLSSMLTAGVAAAFLPSALTYKRRWVKPSVDMIWRSADFIGAWTVNTDLYTYVVYFDPEGSTETWRQRDGVWTKIGTELTTAHPLDRGVYAIQYGGPIEIK